MTVTTTTGFVSYDGDGATVTFATSFKFLANSHVKVTLRDSSDDETEWTEGTQYSLSGAGNASGGTVTVATSPTDYTPATGETLIIELEIPFTQSTSLPLAGQIPSTDVEAALDLAALRDVQLNEVFDRTMRVPTSDSRRGDNLLLPIDTDRASMFLAFNSSGDPIAAAGTSGDLDPVSAFIATLLDDADAAEARATLGVLNEDDDWDFTGTITFPDGVKFISTSAGSDEGPGIDAYRNSASPAASDIAGAFRAKGNSATGVERTYAKWRAVIIDPSNGAEYGRGEAAAILNGTVTTAFSWGGSSGGIWAAGQSDPGSGKFAGSGQPIQYVTASTVTAGSTTTAMTVDDSIPQSSEGAEVLTASITPKNASSTIKIEVSIPWAGSNTQAAVFALFQDATADAFYATVTDQADSGVRLSQFHTFVSAGSTTARTYKLRAGKNSTGTFYWCSNEGSAIFSTVGPEVRITLTEYLP